MHDQRNDQGSILLITVVFILITTVMGLVATQTSIFEIKISENNRQYSEEIAAAEAALNLATSNFRNLPDYTLKGIDGGEDIVFSIPKLLNSAKNLNSTTAVYRNDAYFVESLQSKIEIRRISRGALAAPVLSAQGNKIPSKLTHRYYSGSIDHRRFAMTATAYPRNRNIDENGDQVISSVWVQKGIALPVKQNSDIF